MKKPEETVEVATEFWVDNKDERLASVKISELRAAGYINRNELLSQIEGIRMVVKYVKADGELVSHWNNKGPLVRWDKLLELLGRL